MNVQIEIAKATEKEALRILLTAYLSELRQYNTDSIPEHRPIDYPYFDQYWLEEERIPLLFKQAGENIGFALLNDFVLCPPFDATISMAEFYILPAFRKKGIGLALAQRIFKAYPGKWEIREMEKNIISQHFWSKVIRSFTRGSFKETWISEEGNRFLVQVFES